MQRAAAHGLRSNFLSVTERLSSRPGSRLPCKWEVPMRRLEKTIREIGWTHAVPRLEINQRVSQAFEAMSREVHDCVLVMRERELAGIFTSRDFLNRVAAERVDPSEVVLGEVM